MPEQEIAFRIDEPVVALGAVALLLWVGGERLLRFIGLHQPQATQRQEAFWWRCWHALVFYGALVFSLLDAAMWHWTTVGPAATQTP